MTEEEDLLAAIASDIDADEPRLVYADWLMTRGEPLGELIVLEHRWLKDWSAAPNEVRGQWGTLREQVEKSLLIGGMQREVIGMWLGFVRRLKLTRRAINVLREQPAWLDQAALRFVRELELAVIDPKAWEVVAGWRHRSSVLRFEHGSMDKAVATENLVAIVKHLPHVTSLLLRCPHGLPLDPIAALPLATFELESRGIENALLHNLFAMPWRLAKLRLREVPATATLAPLLEGRVFPDVRDLELVGCPADLVIEGLVASGRIATIETLRLDFTKVPAGSLVRFRNAIAHVALVLPAERGLQPEMPFGVALVQLGRHAEGMAILERLGVPYHERQETLRWHAIALRVVGDRARGRALCTRLVAERAYGRADPLDMLAVTTELLAGGHDPEVVLHHARAQVAQGRGGAAIETLRDEPATASVLLVRALAYEVSGDATRAAAAREALAALALPVYRALVLLLEDRFATVVPPACVEPAAILERIGGGGDDTERYDCAEIAVVAAARAGDRACARARALALHPDHEVRRPWNPDVLAACARAEHDLEPLVKAFVHSLPHMTRGQYGSNLERLVQYDRWLNPT